MPNILRPILAIALPAIVANITVPLMGIMDVAITGHLGNADYIAAIAVGSTLYNVIYWLMGFLRMGTSGLTAQAYGAHNQGQSFSTLARSLSISLLIGMAIVALQQPLCNLGMSFMDLNGNTRVYARQYFNICIWGAPAVLATYSMTGWFLGMQNSRLPMTVSITVNILNMAVSLLLVAVCGLKIEGVAIGTLTAQWVGAVMAFALLLTKYRPDIRLSGVVLAADELARFFRVNRDIFLRTCCLVAVTLWFTRSGATQGSEILAANTLLMQVFTLFSYFIDGFAYSGEALCGRYLGERNDIDLRRCINVLTAIGAAISLIFTTIILIAGRYGLALLTNDQSVIDTAMQYFPFVLAIPIAGFMAFVYDGVCIGLTMTRSMLQSMLLSSAVFFVVWFYFTPQSGNYALWAAFLLYLLVRSIYLLVRVYRFNPGNDTCR